MSCDKLVYDLANEIESTPNVFIKKDWLSILDNQNGNYSSSQCVVDSSQLSNSNKWMSWRESYLLIPMLLTLTSSPGNDFLPATAATSADYSIGLKNWFGNIIHSLTMDLNGVTIIQQTQFSNMWNSFKLMTSLSWNDVTTQGPTIGFFPDDPLAWTYADAPSVLGIGVSNNTNFIQQTTVTGEFNNYRAARGNIGFLKRQQYINYDQDGLSGNKTYAESLTNQSARQLWKNYILTKQNGVDAAGGNPAKSGVFQIAVNATVYLRHLHSFFQMVPLLKGVYLKMTLNLNNCTTVFNCTDGAMAINNVTNSVGGVNPIMVASSGSNNGNDTLGNATYTVNLSVGNNCLNGEQRAIDGVQSSPYTNIQLFVPAYAFNVSFESAYISNPIKKIEYTDIYQYQILNVAANNGTVNSLLTNGISNLKSVLLIPFYSEQAGQANTGIVGSSIPVYQSPFDPAGCCCTSPLSLLTNFNVVVSGQNAIYNTTRYSFQLFNNQLYGANSVNGGLIEGVTSGLIDHLGFEMEYCYHYVNVERMLPIEQSVPKSVQVIGQNTSAKAINLFCFIEYGAEISLNLLTGARV